MATGNLVDAYVLAINCALPGGLHAFGQLVADRRGSWAKPTRLKRLQQYLDNVKKLEEALVVSKRKMTMILAHMEPEEIMATYKR